MFTGIVETIGEVRDISTNMGIRHIKIDSKGLDDDIKIGESISVDGTCVTVTKYENSAFSVDISDETCKRSTLGTLLRGSKVNLERALTPESRMGGHIVQGHIDTVGKVRKRIEQSSAIEFSITVPHEWHKYLAEKGSIAISGVSLTIADLKPDGFTTVIIPHTLQNTTLNFLKQGDPVNLEFDVIAKYIERLLEFKDKKDISKEFLQEYGFA